MIFALLWVSKMVGMKIFRHPFCLDSEIHNDNSLLISSGKSILALIKSERYRLNGQTCKCHVCCNVNENKLAGVNVISFRDIILIYNTSGI